MFKLTQETITQIENVIIPEIKGAAEESMRAYEQGATPDGDNNFDNYMLGCSCWCSTYNRLNRVLDRHPFFSKKTYQKVLTISCPNGSEKLTFYISRVDEKYRVPRACKSIKLYLQEQFFLSNEVQSIIERSSKSIFMIGYDISTIGGLGKITFDMLSATDRNHFQSNTLHIFEEERPLLHYMQPEKINDPTVTREVLANLPKKATK